VLQGHRAAPVQRKFAGGVSCITESGADCYLIEKWECFMSTCMDFLKVVFPEIWKAKNLSYNQFSINCFHTWCPAPSKSWISSAGPSVLRILMGSVLKFYKHTDTGKMPLCIFCRHFPCMKWSINVFTEHMLKDKHMSYSRFCPIPLAPLGLTHNSWATLARISLKLLLLMWLPLAREVRDIFWPRTLMTQQH